MITRGFKSWDQFRRHQGLIKYGIFQNNYSWFQTIASVWKKWRFDRYERISERSFVVSSHCTIFDSIASTGTFKNISILNFKFNFSQHHFKILKSSRLIRFLFFGFHRALPTLSIIFKVDSPRSGCRASWTAILIVRKSDFFYENKQLTMLKSVIDVVKT